MRCDPHLLTISSTPLVRRAMSSVEPAGTTYPVSITRKSTARMWCRDGCVDVAGLAGAQDLLVLPSLPALP